MDLYKHLKNGSFVIIYFLIGLCFLIGDNPDLNRAVLLIAILVIALVQLAHIDPKIEKQVYLPPTLPESKLLFIDVTFQCHAEMITEIVVTDAYDNGLLSEQTIFKMADTSLYKSLEAYLEYRVGRLSIENKIWLGSIMKSPVSSGSAVCYIPHPVSIRVKREDHD